jgi:hypothetical protein
VAALDLTDINRTDVNQRDVAAGLGRTMKERNASN